MSQGDPSGSRQKEPHAHPQSCGALRRRPCHPVPAGRGRSRRPWGRRVIAVRHVHPGSGAPPPHAPAVDAADAADVSRCQLRSEHHPRRAGGQQRRQWDDWQLRRAQRKIVCLDADRSARPAPAAAGFFVAAPASAPDLGAQDGDGAAADARSRSTGNPGSHRTLWPGGPVQRAHEADMPRRPGCVMPSLLFLP